MGKSSNFFNLSCHITCHGQLFKTVREYRDHKICTHRLKRGVCFICETFKLTRGNTHEHRRECLLKHSIPMVGPKIKFELLHYDGECCNLIFGRMKAYEEHWNANHRTANDNTCFICHEVDESSCIDYNHRMECFERNLKLSSPGLKREYFRLTIDRRCCNETFARVSEYENHLRKVHDIGKTNLCYICNAFDETRGINYDHRTNCAMTYFRNDYRKCIGNRDRYRRIKFSYECCGVVYTRTDKLEMHIRESHGDLIWKYGFCFLCNEYSENEYINYDHRLDCLWKKLEKSEPHNRVLKYEEEHRVYVDCSDVKYQLDRIDKYLNCEECHEWLSNRTSDARIYRKALSATIYDDYTNFPDALKLKNNLELDEYCGLDSRWLVLFGERKYKYYHIMIRHQAWNNFLKRAQGLNIYYTPYWCLCTGGGVGVKYLHRHMILVTYENITNLINDLNDESVVRCSSQYREIETYKQLVSTIHYVCNRSSMCRGAEVEAVNKKQKTSNKDCNCHCYINRPIIPHSLYVMSFFNVDGIQTMGNIKYGSASTTDILKFINGIENMDCVELWRLSPLENHIIPVVHGLKFCPYYTDKRLEMGPTSCGESSIVRCFETLGFVDPRTFAACNAASAENGAVMFNVATKSIFKLTLTQKEILSRVGVMQTEIEKLQQEIVEVNNHCEKVQQEMMEAKENNEETWKQDGAHKMNVINCVEDYLKKAVSKKLDVETVAMGVNRLLNGAFFVM